MSLRAEDIWVGDMVGRASSQLVVCFSSFLVFSFPPFSPSTNLPGKSLISSSPSCFFNPIIYSCLVIILFHGVENLRIDLRLCKISTFCSRSETWMVRFDVEMELDSNRKEAFIRIYQSLVRVSARETLVDGAFTKEDAEVELSIA